MFAADPKLEIVQAKAIHCGRILRRLRREHAQSFALVGLNAHRELRATLHNSSYAKAALLDGELAAIWGVTGGELSPYGFVWLCLTNAATAYPNIILREARRQLAEIMKTKVELVTTVLRDDEAALRFAIHLGFHAGHEGMGAPAHTPTARANLVRFAKENPDLRLPAGNSFAIRLGYHYEQAGAH